MKGPLPPRREFLCGLTAMLSTPSVAQVRARYRPPRNRIGQPDLEGVWSSNSGTALERPKAFASLWTTPEEAQAFLKKRRAMAPPADADPVGQSTTEWFEDLPMTVLAGRALTSFIVDPADGQLPYSETGRKTMETFSKRLEQDADNPDSRDVFERCLGGAGGPPLLSIPFGSLFQIIQTRGHVAICAELMHETRIIPIGTGHGPSGMKRWTGDSIARWDGDALVIETGDFHPLTVLRDQGFYISADATVRERFVRTSPSELSYEFEVADPKTYTQTWRGLMVLRATGARIFEYACHEGNYGLEGILAGARAEDGKGDRAKP
jgi:hypothetical protein